MSVVEITAHLDAPIAVSDDLHLDAVLESAHPIARSTPIARTMPVDAFPAVPIPVCALTHDGLRAALCTVAMYPDNAVIRASHLTKRRDAIDVESLARGVHLGLGPGKNRMHRVETVVAHTVTWRAISVRREILRLVRRVQQLGQWRSAGFGIVRAWEVVRHDDLDPVLVLVDQSIAQRHLPASWCEWSEGATLGAFRAPYWHPGRQVEQIVRAGSRCVLKPEVLEACRAVADPDAQRAHRDRKELRRSARRAGAYPPDVEARGRGTTPDPRVA